MAEPLSRRATCASLMISGVVPNSLLNETRTILPASLIRTIWRKVVLLMLSSGASNAVILLLAVAQVAVQCAGSRLSIHRFPACANKGRTSAKASAVLNLFLFFILSAEFYTSAV